MGDRAARPRGRRGFVMLLVLLVALPLPGVAGAQEIEDVRVDDTVRFVVEDGGTLAVDGARRYRDTLELRPGSAMMINELSMEDYVAGVAEMPSRWPGEALKAQAVAARTYAWYSMGLGTFDHYDICATTACQVFRGADVVLDAGERWQEAVDATAGEVLVDADARPILARYFSTSGGRTYANDEVFPSSGPRPYLVAVDDPDDAVSPYHRWTAPFSRQEFDTLLARGDTLRAATPVASVERIGDVTDQGAAIRVTGRDGTTVQVTARALQDFLNRVAPDSFPDRFPTARRDGFRPLPTTIPSSRFDVAVTDDQVVVEGRGWGHGVGMGQYGARGRADRGEPYDAILATYYGGLRPTTPPDLPERIRVGIDVATSVTMVGDRTTTITDGGGEVLVERALGAWTVTQDGTEWRLTPPEGTDAPLDVAPTRHVTALLGMSDAVTVETEVNKPVNLRLEVRDGAGTVIAHRDLGTAEAGLHAATWRYEDADGRLVAPGTYDVALLGTDAAGATAGTEVEVIVEDGQLATGTRAAAIEDGSEPGGRPPLVLLALFALPIALLAVVLSTRKARS